MTRPTVALVAAMSLNRVIGVDNRLPWHLPADLQRFKSLTLGHTIVMGRRTYQSIGRPLPGRRNVIVSRSLSALPGCEIAGDLLTLIEQATDDLYIIGGAEIYAQALPVADRIYLTEVNVELPGDAYFPPLDARVWPLVAVEEFAADDRNAYAMRFLTYQK